MFWNIAIRLPLLAEIIRTVRDQNRLPPWVGPFVIMRWPQLFWLWWFDIIPTELVLGDWEGARREYQEKSILERMEWQKGHDAWVKRQKGRRS
jgi:hypothetical protein